MWGIRFLSGPQTGQAFPLKDGTNTLGRALDCDVKILSPGASKEHLQIEIYSDKIILTDMNSRNGSFVNGVQVRSTRIQPGDRIGVHDILFEIIPFNRSMAVAPSYHGNVAYKSDPFQASSHPNQDSAPESEQEPVQNWKRFIENYLNKALLPGVYKLAELMEFKWVLVLFLGTFGILLTSLSTIPLIQILQESVEVESEQHALTIARNLAVVNRSAVMQGIESALSVQSASNLNGVKKALIISEGDGSIMAPAAQAGSYPNIPFAHEARKRTGASREAVQKVDSQTIVAVVPIEFFNSETGVQSATAFAVVEYDMTSLSVGNEKILSLFIKTLLIALILGTILFFFLYKLIEYPILSLNEQVDAALKEGRDNVHVPFQFPALEKLVSNIGSALARVQPENSGAAPIVESDRRFEMSNLIELIGYGAIAIHAEDLSIYAVNSAFEERTGIRSENIINLHVESVSDQSLKLSLVDLIQRSKQSPDQILTNELEFSGQNFQIAIQAVSGSNRISYFIVVLAPLEHGGGV